MDFDEDHQTVVDMKPPRIKTRSAVLSMKTSTSSNDFSEFASRSTTTINSSRTQSLSQQRSVSSSINETINENQKRIPRPDGTPAMGHRIRSNSITSLNKSTENFFITATQPAANVSTVTDTPTRSRRNAPPAPQNFLEKPSGKNEPALKCIFNVNNKSADVELTNKKISWNFISQTLDEAKTSKSKQGNTELTELLLMRIFSIEPKRSQSITTKMLKFEDMLDIDDDNTIEGFKLHIFKRTKPNHYEHKPIVFLHPHRATCKIWIKALCDSVKNFQIEKKLLVLLNPFSGEKRTRSIYNFNILPILDLINFKIEVIEFHEEAPLRDTIYKRQIMFNSYYGIVILAGDSSVTCAIRDLVEKQMYDNNEDSFLKLNRSSLKTPLCIIPVGTTNMIANSIYGSTSFQTPLMHLIYGNCINIDIGSIYTSDHKLINFAFGLSCGFGANIVRYASKFSRLGTSKIQTAISRAASKNSQKPIEVEIKYVPYANSHPNDKFKCLRGCAACDNQEKRLRDYKQTDEVTEFNLKTDITHDIADHHNLNDSLNDSEKDGRGKKWKTITGSFINIEILVNSMLWDEVCVGGLSKYAHLADGCMDLILVSPVQRSEYKRFLKRHTNRKNQMELPFVKALRVKELKLKIKAQNDVTKSLSTTNTDSTANRFSTGISYDPSMNSLSDSCNSDEDFDQYNRSAVNTNGNSSKNPSQYSGRDRDQDEINEHKNRIRLMRQISADQMNSASSGISQNINKKQELTKSDSENNFNHIPRPESSSTKGKLNFMKSKNFFKKKSQSLVNKLSNSIENLRQSTGDLSGIGRSKMQKANAFKTPFAWNMDWNLCAMPYIHMKCNRQFLPVFALGLDPDSELEESTSGCFFGLAL